MKYALRIKLLVVMALLCTLNSHAVSVTLTTDESFSNTAIIRTMEHNLAAVLTEINNANSANRDLDIRGLKMNKFAQDALLMLWANIHFYCDDEEVVDRCWNLKNGYLVRQVPMIINPGADEFGNGTYQEAVVEFDRNGTISDFRFALDAQLSESMERCGEVVELERRFIILDYVERFRTAYCNKDIAFLEQVFSDDALIITGKVVMNKRTGDYGGATFDVVYNKQNKQQYLANLRRAFLRNKYVKVEFEDIGDGGSGSCAGITRSLNNKNMYGVRLRQKWQSSSYSDEGYVFLLWDFTNEDEPQIHVRTWQPTLLPNGMPIEEKDIFSLSNFLL